MKTFSIIISNICINTEAKNIFISNDSIPQIQGIINTNI